MLETIKGELSMAQISSKYGIHTTQITNWKKQGIELLIQGFKCNKSTGDRNRLCTNKCGNFSKVI